MEGGGARVDLEREVDSEGPVDGLVVEDQCADDCNSGWMNQIEIRARDLIIPMLRGESRQLNVDEQRRIATWACLKTIVAEAVNPRTSVLPRAWADELYATKTAPPQMAVSLMAVDDKPPYETWYSHEVYRQGGRPIALLTAFALGCVVFRVGGIVAPIQPGEPIRNEHYRTQIWPLFGAGRVWWPPSTILTHEGMRIAGGGFSGLIDVAEAKLADHDIGALIARRST